MVPIYGARMLGHHALVGNDDDLRGIQGHVTRWPAQTEGRNSLVNFPMTRCLWLVSFQRLATSIDGGLRRPQNCLAYDVTNRAA